MVYVEFWDSDSNSWQLARMNFIEAFLCCLFGEDVHYVPKSKIHFY